jgi:hypothetical protein
MSRLVDIDEVIRVAENTFPQEDVRKIMWILCHTPTAYDVEKVVAELEEMIKPKQFYFCKYAKGGCKYIDDDKKDCMECVVEHAIEIVKRGGAE